MASSCSIAFGAEVEGVFEAGTRLLVSDQRGLLARLATEIADAGANIEYVSMERPDGDCVVNMFFSVQVRDRQQLAHVLAAVELAAGIECERILLDYRGG